MSSEEEQKTSLSSTAKDPLGFSNSQWTNRITQFDTLKQLKKRPSANQTFTSTTSMGELAEEEEEEEEENDSDDTSSEEEEEEAVAAEEVEEQPNNSTTADNDHNNNNSVSLAGGCWQLREWRNMPEVFQSYLSAQPRGHLMYTSDGFVSFFMANPQRSLITVEEVMSGSADTDEMLRSFKDFGAYVGKYEVDYASGEVTHIISDHTVPGMRAKVVKRSFKCTNNGELHLSTTGDDSMGTLILTRAEE